MLGEWCYECKDTVTEETFRFPSMSSSPRPTTLVGKPWYQTSHRRESSPSPSPTRWCRICAATTIGESCFVGASVVTKDTLTFHSALFSQGPTVIIGDVWYHTSRKRMSKFRRRLHETNDYEGFIDAPLPPIIMDFARTRFEDYASQGIAQESEDDSLIGHAKQLVTAGLITKIDDRMLSTVCSLIIELWFHGRNVFESEIIEVSNPNRLDEEDRYDWVALGLALETHEDSILGLTKKLAAMRYLTKEDEAVIENYCVEIATRWAEYADETRPEYEPSARVIEQPEEYDSDYDSEDSCVSDEETDIEDTALVFVRPRLLSQEAFTSQSEEIDALLDARAKLAHIHILASDDEPESLYHLDPDVPAQIDFLTNMPSPQTPCEEPVPRRWSKHMLSEVEWEMLNSLFNRDSGHEDYDIESEPETEYTDEDADATYDTESTASYYSPDDFDESASIGIHTVDTVHDLPSLVDISPMLFPSPMYSATSSTLFSSPGLFMSPKSSTCSACQVNSSSSCQSVSSVYLTPTVPQETMQDLLQRRLREATGAGLGEPSGARASKQGVECRMINQHGEAFEWAILL